MVNPAAAALFIRARNERGVGVPLLRRGRPHSLRLRTHNPNRPVALKLQAVAAVKQAPIRPWFGDDCRQLSHAARASFAPTDAKAFGPSLSARPAARALS